jgi:hypothetical protein
MEISIDPRKWHTVRHYCVQCKKYVKCLRLNHKNFTCCVHLGLTMFNTELSCEECIKHVESLREFVRMITSE